MSPMLRNALQAYLDWVDGGAMHMGVVHFSTSRGLCDAVSRFGGLFDGRRNGPCANALRCELSAVFARQGLDTIYPFGGCRLYDSESYLCVSHHNKERLAWVRKMLSVDYTAQVKLHESIYHPLPDPGPHIHGY